MRSKARFLGKAVLGLAAVAILGGIVMLLWNAIIPDLFAGARAIDYPHALGLLVLSRILFGGLRGHGGWHRHHHGEGHHDGHHRWHRWHGGRWSAITPEERERLRQHGPWGRHAGHAERAE
jgi:hypothetical protein